MKGIPKNTQCQGLTSNNGSTYYRCSRDAKHKIKSIFVCTAHQRQLIHAETKGQLDSEIQFYLNHRGV